MFSFNIDRMIAAVDRCPWSATAGLAAPNCGKMLRQAPRPLYTPEERRRRDETPWTLVQGILAPVQFLVFLISLYFVVSYLVTGEGYAIATGSVVVKTLVLYTIMITGAIWEKEVYGCYLFAPSFYWEDVFSMLVLALHTAYLATVFLGLLGAEGQMVLALAAYVTYVINATQFVLKLRAARLQSAGDAAARASAQADAQVAACDQVGGCKESAQGAGY